MRKFFYALGIIFGILLLVVAGLVAYTVYTGVSIDKDAKQYADDSVISITSKWDVKELKERATPELMKQGKPEDLDRMFVWFATLGPLLDYGGSKQINWTTGIGSDTATIANYAGVGNYKEGSATIRIQIKKTGGAWRVNGLNVDSSKLMEKRLSHGP